VIRLGWCLALVWCLVEIVINLAVVCGLLYDLLWLGTWMIALGVRYPWITAAAALVSFAVNGHVVAAAHHKRQNWRATFFGEPTP